MRAMFSKRHLASSETSGKKSILYMGKVYLRESKKAVIFHAATFPNGSSIFPNGKGVDATLRIFGTGALTIGGSRGISAGNGFPNGGA